MGVGKKEDEAKKASDFIEVLAEKHQRIKDNQSIKYWQRKRPKEVKPLETKTAKKRPDHKENSVNTLFHSFTRAGNLPEAHMPAILLPLEKLQKLKTFINEIKAKRVSPAVALSFFHVLRENEEKVNNNQAFQRRLDN